MSSFSPFSLVPGKTPPYQCNELPFYTSISFPFFTHVSVSPCSGWLLVLSILTSEWLGKAGQHGMSMGLSGDGLHIKALAAFSLVLLLYWICPFLQAFLWDVGRKVVLGHILGPSRSFHCAFLAVRLLGLGFGLLIQSGLGPQISGPTWAYIQTNKNLLLKKFVKML